MLLAVSLFAHAVLRDAPGCGAGAMHAHFLDGVGVVCSAAQMLMCRTVLMLFRNGLVCAQVCVQCAFSGSTQVGYGHHGGALAC